MCGVSTFLAMIEEVAKLIERAKFRREILHIIAAVQHARRWLRYEPSVARMILDRAVKRCLLNLAHCLADRDRELAELLWKTNLREVYRKIAEYLTRYMGDLPLRALEAPWGPTPDLTSALRFVKEAVRMLAQYCA